MLTASGINYVPWEDTDALISDIPSGWQAPAIRGPGSGVSRGGRRQLRDMGQIAADSDVWLITVHALPLLLLSLLYMVC